MRADGHEVLILQDLELNGTSTVDNVEDDDEAHEDAIGGLRRHGDRHDPMRTALLRQ